MAKSMYKVNTEGQVALAANTPKTVIGVKAHANSGLNLKSFRVDFDGVTATEKPVLVEVCYCTWATNSPGTNSTSTTPRQIGGRAITAGFTSGKSWTSEPTVLTVLEEFSFDPNKGLFLYDYSLGDEPDCAVSEGFAVRMTVPSGGAAVNARAGLTVERI